MQCVSNSRIYNCLVMKPNDKTESELFWKWRMADVGEMLVIYCVIYLLFWLGSILEWITSTDKAAVSRRVLFLTGQLILNVIAVILIRRFRRMACLVIVILLAYIEITLAAGATADIKTVTEMKLWSFQLFLTNVIFCMLLSPSLGVTAIYILEHCIAIVLLVSKKTGMEDAEEADQLLIYLPFAALCSFGIFTILHRRELKRFLQQRKSERKEQETQRKKDQLSGVLNAASDGIVVVKSRKRHVGDEETGRTREHGLPSILFCNTKSITLFGHNFSQTQTGGAPEEQAQIALDEPRFTPRGDAQNDTVESSTKRDPLLSLKDIIRIETKISDVEAVESYQLQAEDAEDKTIIVKRTDLEYDDEECQVLNFADITAFELLRKREETVQHMKDINASVHHEMMGPLSASSNISKRLLKVVTNATWKRMIKTIFVSSQLVLMHSSDLLDQRIIQNGGFVPSYQ